MAKPEDKHQLVRGVLGVGGRSSSCVTTDENRAKEFGCIVAYTHWYRHDDDLNRLEAELESLVRCYMKMPYTSGVVYGYEYKDYVK